MLPRCLRKRVHPRSRSCKGYEHERWGIMSDGCLLLAGNGGSARRHSEVLLWFFLPLQRCLHTVRDCSSQWCRDCLNVALCHCLKVPLVLSSGEMLRIFCNN